MLLKSFNTYWLIFTCTISLDIIVLSKNVYYWINLMLSNANIIKTIHLRPESSSIELHGNIRKNYKAVY